MKCFLWTLLWCAALLPLAAQELPPTLWPEARACAEGIAKGDFKLILDHTHPRILKAMGGHDAALVGVKATIEEMHAKGISFLSAEIGQPAPPQKIGEWLVSLVPEHVVMKVPGGRLEQRAANLIGISEDEGKHWFFADAATGPAAFFKIFPELAGKLTFPERGQPVFTKD